MNPLFKSLLILVLLGGLYWYFVLRKKTADTAIEIPAVDPLAGTKTTAVSNAN